MSLNTLHSKIQYHKSKVAEACVVTPLPRELSNIEDRIQLLEADTESLGNALLFILELLDDDERFTEQ